MHYRKRPVVIEAIQLRSDTLCELYDFLGITGKGSFLDCGHGIDPTDGKFKITTLEGVHVAELDDFIIRGVKGEFYPCKPDIFEATYELVAQDDESQKPAHNKQSTPTTTCPMCGCPCIIGGDDKEGTHYYVPCSQRTL